MSYTSQNFRLFLVSNLSVLNFRIFSAHVSGVAVATIGNARASLGDACGYLLASKYTIHHQNRYGYGQCCGVGVEGGVGVARSRRFWLVSDSESDSINIF